MTVMEDWCVSSYKNDLPLYICAILFYAMSKRNLRKKISTLNEIEKMYGGTI